MNDLIPDAEASHCLENFETAAGRKKGEFYGAVFRIRILPNGWKQSASPWRQIKMRN